MYEGFYGLKADPFRLSTDHRFCYNHRSYARAKAYVQYALHRAEGFVLITGRPGTGKTTLVNDLLATLPNKEAVVGTLVSTQLEAEDLLLMTGHAFGLDFESSRKALVLQQLNEFFREQHEKGRRVLLIIDEAQDLAPSALEELRLLTNLQHRGAPLLQIALLGQEGLRDIVRAPEMEQVHQRLIAAWQLQPLTPEETVGYVRHRLEQAGWKGDPALAPGVLEVVYRFSKGIPRRINLICSRLLLHGFMSELHSISVEDAETVTQDLRREELAPPDYEAEAGAVALSGPARKERNAPLALPDDAVWKEIDVGLFRSHATESSGHVAPIAAARRADTGPTRPVAPPVAASREPEERKSEEAVVAGPVRERRAEGSGTLEPLLPMHIVPEVDDFRRQTPRPHQEQAEGRNASRSRSRLLPWILALSIIWLVLLAVFFYQNRNEVPTPAAVPQGSNMVAEPRQGQDSSGPQGSGVASSAPPDALEPEPAQGDIPVSDEALTWVPLTTDAVGGDPVERPPALEDTTPLSGRVLFRINSTTVDAEFLPLIDGVVGELSASEHAYAQIIGYTDRFGSLEYNMYLSQLRARAVADLLILRGVAAERLVIEGHGPRDPDPDEAISRQEERAVEITVRRRPVQ